MQAVLAQGKAVVRRPRLAALVVPFLVIVLALTAIGYAGKGAFESAHSGAKLLHRPNSEPDQLALRNIFEQLRDDMARLIPPGTRMYPVEPWDLWRHRLIEFGIMAGAIVVMDPEQADVRVSIVRDATAQNHVRLVVERLR